MTAIVALLREARPKFRRTKSWPGWFRVGAGGGRGGRKVGPSAILLEGAAAGHHVRRGEELQVADGSDDADEEEGRPEHRQGDVPELPPAARAVDPRRLVELLGDILEAGEKNDHVVAEVLPHGEKDDRRH